MLKVAVHNGDVGAAAGGDALEHGRRQSAVPPGGRTMQNLDRKAAWLATNLGVGTVVAVVDEDELRRYASEGAVETHDKRANILPFVIGRDYDRHR
jgi:hypothetical protein